MMRFTQRVAAAAVAAGIATAVAQAQLSAGPDVTLRDPYEVFYFGTLNNVRAYAIGSHTCNIGNQNLIWTNGGTPALAMNAFRLHDGRLVQIGMSWVKHACCAGAANACGLGCNGVAGTRLGPGCRDSYSATYNGGQLSLGPRSGINAWTGQLSALPGGTGNVILRRLQIAAADLDPASFPEAQYFVDGVYVSTDDAAAGNSDNNATYRRVTLSGTAMSVQGQASEGKPAIHAWREHGGGANIEDTSVTVQNIDVPGEGRFIVAHRAVDKGNGRWQYEYAVYNLNSDRSGGSFAVPLNPRVNITPASVGFHDVNYHSGEPYDNTDWSITVSETEVRWSSPQTFAQNPNSNALRWGTMYNFWFEADTGPELAEVSLGLFKPYTPTAVSFTAVTPQAGCAADFDDNGVHEVPDIFAFLAAWFSQDPRADWDGSGGPPVVPDIFAFLAAWFAGC